MSNEYDISRAFKRIENDLMESMVRNLKRHRAEEDELGMHWEQWQALQFKELERYRAENADKFTGDFTDINAQIDDLIRTTYDTAETDEEKNLLEKIRKGQFKPTQKKDVEFFALNDDKLNILLERTKADFSRAEYAVLRRADDAYRRVIFDAQVYANVTNDYNKAVDMATHDFIKNGLQSVQYKNGSRHNISDYARMAIRTTNKRAYLMGQGNAHDKYGIHTVRVNRRTQACPLCVGFLGKVLVDDVYGGGTAKEASDLGVPTLSSAMQAGFLHPNCKDIYSLYIEGISQPPRPWTQQEIDDIVGEYNQEQALKHAEDMAESYTRLAKFALSPDNAQKYQARADSWQTRVDEIQGITPAPMSTPQDRVDVLRDLIKEQEAKVKEAQRASDDYKSDVNEYKNQLVWAQITHQDFDAYISGEIEKALAEYNAEPNEINERYLNKLKRIRDNASELAKGKKLKELNAEVSKQEKKLKELQTELQAELDAIDKAKRKESTFDINSVNWSKYGSSLYRHMNTRGVEYREVYTLDKALTETEIIQKLAGGDLTDGSCMSLAQAYIANKHGLDVTDYRGGQSCYVMSYAKDQITRLAGVTPMAEQGGTIRPAKALLAKVEEGKEYYFITGRHASIVRRSGGELQYLELQSASDSGWQPFEKDVILWKGFPNERTIHHTVSDTLKERFACNRGTRYEYSYLVDIDQYKDSEEFRGLMGYINTAEHRQKKGALGSVK